MAKKLDIACGNHKQAADWIGMDIQHLPGVDIVHDVNMHPWPVDDASIDQVPWKILKLHATRDGNVNVVLKKIDKDIKQHTAV